MPTTTPHGEIRTRQRRARPAVTEDSGLTPGQWSDHKIIQCPIEKLTPYARNSRRHSDKQIGIIARSIEQFGFVNPVLIDENNVIVAGHGRYEAALRLGRKSVPTLRLAHLSPDQLRAYRIADNRIAELSGWDDEMLRIELGALSEIDLDGALEFDLSLTGFEIAEIDILLDPVESDEKIDPADAPLAESEDTPAVTRAGDLWILGDHRLFCGDALQPESYSSLLGEEKARMVFTDPPYNVPINGHVSGLGATKHREFAMASGEMSRDEFTAFLRKMLEAVARVCVDGAILMTCMDWRHLRELLEAGERADLSLIQFCVWNKTNGGMGSLYRSKHELVCVFKSGDAPHVNNVELGKHGRYRTNVWDYAGVNTFRRGRDADLADHPTVKPTILVADGIRDVTHRGDIVLDPFGGSGTTLLACEKTRRRGRAIELDPQYVDVAIRRWQALTGRKAQHAQSGMTFDERAASTAVDGIQFKAATQGGTSHV